MNKIIFLIIAISSSIFSQQKYYTFSELRGIEDNEGNTHLFYRLHHFSGNYQSNYNYENSIYHLNTGNKSDSLYLPEYSYSNQLTSYSIITHDFDLWDKDPAKYIYCTTDNAFLWFKNISKINSPTTSIIRFDQDIPVFSNISGYAKVRISKQNDSLLYAINGLSLRSTDGGSSWKGLHLEELFFSDVNPYNDNFIFLFDYSERLYKSTDGGETAALVDTTSHTSIGTSWNPNHFEYDPDMLHIYRVFENSLFISDNKGDPFTWQKKYSSENSLFISIDSSLSGHIYLAEGKYIYHSSDYGETFSLFKEFDKKLVGIYKKPSSDVLYAATKYDLFEINSDTLITLKHFELDPDILNWFPLETGNKWVYNHTFTTESEAIVSTKYSEVKKIIFYKDKKYFQLEGTGLSSSYYRVDSTSGKIYRSYFNEDSLVSEVLFIDLLAEPGDTFYVEENQPVKFQEEKPISIWNINTLQRNYTGQSTPLHNYSLIKNIGLYNELWWELVGSESVLKGAVINGIVFGDTTLVDVNDKPEIIPTKFSLSQNYPNPFNPATKLSFAIGHSAFVSLEIYDILGNEVSTLVNEDKPAGFYEIKFDGSNLSSGIYFYVLKAGGKTLSKKMCLMK